MLIEDYSEYPRDHGTEDDVDRFANQRYNVLQSRRQILNDTKPGELFDEFEGLVQEEEKVEDIPDTFVDWRGQRPPEEELPEDEQMGRDIEEYEHVYLRQNSFPARHLLEFRDTVTQIRQREMNNLSYQALRIQGQARMSFREFVPQQLPLLEPLPLDLSYRRHWDRFLMLLGRYETYLEHPDHVAHFRHIRAQWADADRRELTGLPRDPFDEISEVLDQSLRVTRGGLQNLRKLIVVNLRNMTPAQRDQIKDSIAELEPIVEDIESHVARRRVPWQDEEQRNINTEILPDAQTIFRETIEALMSASASQTHPPPPTPTQSPPCRERERTPASETSHFDDDDRMIELIRELEGDRSDADDDDTSTMFADDRDEEMSDMGDNWA